MYNLDFLRRFSLMGTTLCAVPNNLSAILTNYHVFFAMPTWYTCTSTPILFWHMPHLELQARNIPVPTGACLTLYYAGHLSQVLQCMCIWNMSPRVISLCPADFNKAFFHSRLSFQYMEHFAASVPNLSSGVTLCKLLVALYDMADATEIDGKIGTQVKLIIFVWIFHTFFSASVFMSPKHIEYNI